MMVHGAEGDAVWRAFGCEDAAGAMRKIGV